MDAVEFACLSNFRTGEPLQRVLQAGSSHLSWMVRHGDKQLAEVLVGCRRISGADGWTPASNRGTAAGGFQSSPRFLVGGRLGDRAGTTECGTGCSDSFAGT
jgi:hypothetical protein